MSWTVYNEIVFNLDKVADFAIHREHIPYNTEPKKEKWLLKAIFGISGFWSAEEMTIMHEAHLGKFETQFEAQVALREILNGDHALENSDFGMIEVEPTQEELPQSDAVDDEDGASEDQVEDIPF